MKTLKLCAIAAVAIMATGALQAAETFVPGKLNWQFWSTAKYSRATLEADLLSGATLKPTDRSGQLDSFETIVNQSDEYIQRVFGFFVPPEDGDYAFDISSDDDSDLYLSTDATAANKRIIAQVAQWSNSREWNNTTAGHSTTYGVADPDTGLTPFANGIHLLGGHQYYIEAVHHEGGGGDDLSVYFRKFDDPIPANGTAPNLAGNTIGINITTPTSLTITRDPQTQSTPAGIPVHLNVAYTTDSSVTPSFVWRSNNIVLTNITGTNLTIYGAGSYDVILSIPGGISKTSAPAVVTISGTATPFDGFLKREFFPGKSRADVEIGNTGAPATVTLLDQFESPTNVAEDYSQRISGIFTAPVSGAYNFMIAADDDSDLFLSTTENPANKRVIAGETGWSGVRSWTTVGGGTLSQKNSATFVVPVDDGMGGTTDTTPYADGIQLVAGQKYYIEAVEHEGGGGDNLAVTYYITGEDQPVNGDASRITNSTVSVGAVTGAITVTTAPHNITIFEGVNTNFSVAATITGELSPVYQWYFNNTPIPNANGTSLPITGVVSAGGNYTVVISAPGATSKTNSATLTVNLGVTVVGYVKEEFYKDKTRPDVENGTAGDPTYTSILNIFEFPTNTADNYATKTYGFFIPPVTGDYAFIIATDDDSDLFLSTNDNPSNKRLIAGETGWSGVRNWTGVGGGTLSQKNSSTYVLNGATPYAAGIHLVQGQKYYIEAYQHEGGGGDNMAVTFYGIDEATATDYPAPANGDAPRLTGTNIAFVTVAAHVGITNQPQSQSVTENDRVVFSVGSTNDVAFANTFQWRSNNVDIEGATQSTYIIPNAPIEANNAHFSVVVTTFGGTPVTSADAILTVIVDTTRPTLISAGTSTPGYITLKFSEGLDSATATDPLNYTVSGATSVDSADLARDGKTVVLRATGAPATGGTVSVKNVTDIKGNAVAAGGASVSVPVYHPAIPGLIDQDINTVLVGGAGAYSDNEWEVTAGGEDWWGTSDQIHFVGTKVTGDFDESVQLIFIDPVNRWSKAGLSVRESLEGPSREMGVYASPAPVPVADNATETSTEHFGNNLFEAPLRNTTGGDTGGWNTSPVPVPFLGGPSNPGFNPSGLGEDTSNTNVWVRLQRVGSTFTAYVSRNGTAWTTFAVRTENIPYTDQYVGLTLTAHNGSIANNSHFANWSRAGGPPVTPTLSYTKTATTITITWANGLLLSSDTANGTYTDAGAGAQAGTITVNTTAGSKFYVVKH